jgi:hypothetical protein
MMRRGVDEGFVLRWRAALVLADARSKQCATSFQAITGGGWPQA